MPQQRAHVSEEFLAEWLNATAGEGISKPPIFPADGDNIEVLATPKQFFETLCDEISVSRSRISLAALYIGPGELERKMLSTIRSKVQEQLSLGTRFDVSILVDHSRALRPLDSDVHKVRCLLACSLD